MLILQILFKLIRCKVSRIFISYKRVDKEKVFKIKDQIESALGEECWIDLDGIEGDTISHITIDAIEQSSIVLFFYGKDTENSQWQRRELEYARANGKTIIPIILAEIPEDSWYKCYFDKFPVISTDDCCPEFILKEISTASNHHPNATAPAESAPKLAYSASYTKSCGCGCLIGLVAFVAIFLLFVPYGSAPDPFVPHGTAPDSSPIRESSHQRDSIVQEHSNYGKVGASPKDEMMARPPEFSAPSSTSHPSEKPNPNRGNQSFCKRYNTKDLTLLSEAELDKEYTRTIIIADSLYESIRDNASARYDLQDLHKYQLLIREEQITRKTNIVADTIETNNVAEDKYCKDNVDAELYTDYSSDRESLPSWIWPAGLILMISFVMPILYIRKKKNKKGQGKEVLPLFRQTKEIKIFIAGSTRLVSEREALRATISKMYNQHKSDNLVVEAYEFDDFPREYVEGGQQKLYDEFIRNEANWVVFITDGTIGDKTIWELENAIKVHKETGRPKILMYSIPQNITDNQKDQMSQFKSILNREDNYWIDYDDVSTIRSTFREHLEWDLINLMKQELLRRVG